MWRNYSTPLLLFEVLLGGNKMEEKRQKRCKNEKDRPSVCTGKGAALLKAVSDLALQVPQR